VIDLLVPWIEEIDTRWCTIESDGLTAADRTKKCKDLFSVINLTLMVWHYTVTHGGCGIFFNFWSLELLEVARSSVLSRYAMPARTADKEGAKRLQQHMRVLNSEVEKKAPAKKGKASFSSLMDGAGSLSSKQRKQLMAKLGRDGGGGTDRAKPQKIKQEQKIKKERKPRAETRKCFKCDKVGHIAADCPSEAAGPRADGGGADA